jgi:exopolyphosphatase/guanosine-5'-triphosphate,3'-diphosphate pyrophosphatase
MGVEALEVVATAAVREAADGAKFIAEIEDICGVPVHVLTGGEEARMAALGVVAGFEHPDGVAGDLGGGSLELTEVTGREVGEGDSLPLGGLRLQADSKGSLKTARELTRKALDKSDAVGRLDKRVFYAIGGTWRSLARLHMHDSGYPLHVMHEYQMDPDELDDFLKVLIRGPLDQVPGISVVSKQRQALLPYGAVVLSELIRTGRPASVTISALGLREGLLYAKLSAREQRTDPLLSAASELNVLRSRSPAHGEELIPWTAQAMAAIGLEETEEESRLRAAACLLADIGWRAHPDYRGIQSLNLVAHGTFVGVDHPGRAFLAFTVYYRNEGLVKDELSQRLIELVDKDMLKRARILGSAFRAAHMVSAAMPGVLTNTPLTYEGNRLIWTLPEPYSNLEGERVERRFKDLANLLDREGEIRVGSAFSSRRAEALTC